MHDITANTITKLYDASEFDEPVLTGVDNVTVAPSGDVLIAEDGGNLEIVVISADKREAAPLVRLPGTPHAGSEITGPSFSPDGRKLYFSSQRGGIDAPGEGMTYEVTGPFRLERVGIAAVGAASAGSTTDAAPDPDDEPTGAVDDGTDGDELVAAAGWSALAGLAAIATALGLRRRRRQTDSRSDQTVEDDR